MTTTIEAQTLTRVGDKLAFVFDAATLERLGITAETPVNVTEAGGALLLTPQPPQRDPSREANFAASLDTMSKRYEQTLRRLAE